MTDRRKFWLLAGLLVASLALAWLVTSAYGQTASNALR